LQIDIAGSEVRYVPATHGSETEQLKHEVADESANGVEISVDSNHKYKRLVLIECMPR
jgi:hypothetical protein